MREKRNSRGESKIQVEMGKQYKTRSGKEVRLYATDCGGVYTVHGPHRSGEFWAVGSWLSNGESYRGGVHELDLVEVKPRIQREVWLNIYGNDTDWCVHNSRADADRHSAADRLACVKVTIDYEEGEGL